MIALLAISTTSMAQSMKCPDNKHPHMIDLGLPSGTKWACCNLGASNPYNWGDTYQWGETTISEENANSDTYDFYDSKTKTFKDIGENISGTKYDAARAKWGGKWRMPTKEEMNELLSNCTLELKEKKGTPIYVFKAKNKASICFPMNFFTEDGIGDIIVLTNYWTATQSESLFLGPSKIGDEEFKEVLGLSRESNCYIRPVCK